MITHLEISGFKSFRHVSLDLGGVNVLIGTNASGKTNFFDALRVLQGIGYGFTIDEIFNGKPKSASGEVWEPIRGKSGNAGFLDWATGRREEPVQFAVTVKPSERSEELRYLIALSPMEGKANEESLYSGDSPVFRSESTEPWDSEGIPVHVGHDDEPVRNELYSPAFEAFRPVLRQLLNRPDLLNTDLLKTCSRLLSNIQLLDPTPANLRAYTEGRNVSRMGDRGENFAGLVQSILGDQESAAAYTSWLKQLTPAELDEVVTLHGALQEPLFALRKGGHDFPAPVLSDGTLRFAAIAAAFFQPDMPEMILIEEVENGIHPTRLRLLMELLKSQAARGAPQVMVTSHSPLVLAWLNEEDYKTTFFFSKDDETGASTITPLSKVPRFQELTHKYHAADLFAEGWLEGAL